MPIDFLLSLGGLVRGGSVALLGTGAVACLGVLFGIGRARKMASEKRMASTLAAAIRGGGMAPGPGRIASPRSEWGLGGRGNVGF